MQTKFIKHIKYALLFTALCAVFAGTIFTSCSKDDDNGNGGQVVLNSFGPMPIARGAELRFIGENLDKVTSIVLPGNIEITTFTAQSSKLLTITVPQNAVEGLVVLKTPDGDITTKTALGFSEPISIASFSPAIIRTDSVLTINGDYLNLVKQIIFTDRVAIGDTAFTTHTRYQIKVKVPAAAQTGKFIVSNGAADPILVYSATSLTVKLPIFSTTTQLTPNPVKAGTSLTINGSYLDLVKSVVFGGDKIVTTFTTQNFNQIVLTVPADAKDGKVTLMPASGVKIVSAADLIMVVPAVSVTPTSVKNGGTITVTGTNLDLISLVTFGGSQAGTIQSGGTSIQILVTVPDKAVTGEVTFTTKATKTVSGGTLTLIDPTFTSFSPTTAKAKTNLVITGTDLDLVTSVTFTGGFKGTIGTRTETELNVTVPYGATDGLISLITKNGSQINSADPITVLANLPIFSSYSETRGFPGKILTLNGTNMSLIKSLVFPGNVIATDYGIKTDSKVEVYVPTTVYNGKGKIKVITYEGEVGYLPELFFGSVDFVYKQDLCYFDFNGTGKDSWWGGAIGSGTSSDASLTGDGTSFWRINGMGGTGWWDGLFFRNGSNNFVTTGVDASTWAVRFDINVLETITEGDLRIRLGSFFYHFQPWNGLAGGYKTNGWITVTCPLSQFMNEATPLTDPSVGGSEFGMIWAWGTSVKVNMCIDNIRFEPIP
jgi:hypothetical protein